MAREIQSKRMADEFVVHSTEEQGHGDEIAEPSAQQSAAPDLEYVDNEDSTRRVRCLKAIGTAAAPMPRCYWSSSQ
jgi:hypothetical protein